MPELPEVENVVRGLRPHLLGKKIMEFKPLGVHGRKRLFRDHKNPNEVRSKVLGREITKIERLGKNIFISLDDTTCIALHLMMTGTILVNPVGKRAHDRLFVKLSDGTVFVFNDIRTFGRCRIVQEPEILAGPDALCISYTEFSRRIRSRGGVIKNLLLDQHIVAGIGNIYADEILWYAKVSPLRKGNTLAAAEAKKIYGAMRAVLKQAIAKGGSTARNYAKPDGSPGAYYAMRKAYRRTGEPCEQDDAIVKKIMVGQRATHFCPAHQR